MGTLPAQPESARDPDAPQFYRRRHGGAAIPESTPAPEHTVFEGHADRSPTPAVAPTEPWAPPAAPMPPGSSAPPVVMQPQAPQPGMHSPGPQAGVDAFGRPIAAAGWGEPAAVPMEGSHRETSPGQSGADPTGGGFVRADAPTATFTQPFPTRVASLMIRSNRLIWGAVIAAAVVFAGVIVGKYVIVGRDHADVVAASAEPSLEAEPTPIVTPEPALDPSQPPAWAAELEGKTAASAALPAVAAPEVSAVPGGESKLAATAASPAEASPAQAASPAGDAAAPVAKAPVAVPAKPVPAPVGASPAKPEPEVSLKLRLDWIDRAEVKIGKRTFSLPRDADARIPPGTYDVSWRETPGANWVSAGRFDLSAGKRHLLRFGKNGGGNGVAHETEK